MGLFVGICSSVPESTVIFGNTDRGDSSKIHGFISVVNNKVLATCPFCGSVRLMPLEVRELHDPSQVDHEVISFELSQEVDQEVTSDSTADSQHVESHQLVSPTRTIEGRRNVNGHGELVKNRKRSSKKSASPKKKRAAS